jgi:Alternative oxidase
MYKLQSREMNARCGCQLPHIMVWCRLVFLETTAGVPGIVGGMIRHLHSLRLMRRDNGAPPPPAPPPLLHTCRHMYLHMYLQKPHRGQHVDAFACPYGVVLCLMPALC